MEKQHLHRVFAILFAFVILFPTTIQAIHALENHEHVICTAKDIKHIHEQNDDCGIYHTQIENNDLLLDNTTDCLISNVHYEYSKTKPQINSLGFIKLKSSRGPPMFS